jgi:hypothetical protein
MRAAQLDAVRAGLGSIDDFRPWPGEDRTIYLHPFVRIEMLAEAETMPSRAA